MPLGKLDLDDWLAGNVKPPFEFHPGEPVRVVVEGKAIVGKVARPLSNAPDPEYLIELETNEDVAFRQSELTSLAD